MALMKSVERTLSIPMRFRYLLLLATVCGGSFLITPVANSPELLFSTSKQPISSTDLHRDEIIQPEASYTIKTEGCTIPSLQPLDDSIKKFNQPPTQMKQCPNANYSLLLYNETHIWVNRKILQYYNVTTNDGISCCYKSFSRPSTVPDVYSSKVDDRVEYNVCKDFNNNIEIADEFVSVTCDYKEKKIYEQYFIFAIKKTISQSSSSEQKNKADNYNVIVMGIDSVSRLNFYRTMPKTLAYLKNKGAIELMGYNKVGDNTFPNLIPMLLGIDEEDLKRTCLPHIDDNFDNCPFIWQWYKDAGYYTALGEDSAIYGTFNYARSGFIKTPTDYYTHTFMNEAEEKLGNTKEYNIYLCMGNRYFYKVLLNYITDLTSVLKHSKLFGFFWEVSMSHDDVNYPMAMDDSYHKFLEKLDNNSYLNNTVLILLSDHGIRWGDIRLTKQGRLEERLPFVHILLPESFPKNHNLAYKNLKQNSERLTTPADIYPTLTDLVDLDTIRDDKITSRLETSYSHSRSISLFLPIPRNRTCGSAGIPDHFCTCNTGTNISTASFEARVAAEQLVDHLNMFLVEHPQCAKLRLVEVLEVQEMTAGRAEKDEVGWREFMAVVRTAPGNGVFEGTLRRALAPDDFTPPPARWVLSGTVSRLNLYGQQSRCMHHHQLKLYCYCQYPSNAQVHYRVSHRKLKGSVELQQLE